MVGSRTHFRLVVELNFFFLPFNRMMYSDLASNLNKNSMAEFWQQQQLQIPQLQTIQEALREASKDVPNVPSSIQSLIGLIIVEADNTLKSDPSLSKLSELFSKLQTLLEKLEKSRRFSISSFIIQCLTSYEVSQVVAMIEKEINGWVAREVVINLVFALERSSKEDEKIKKLEAFEKRVRRGFDRDLQESILRGKIFSMLEKLLCDTTCCNKVREQCALAISALTEFNRNVFVGLVLMGPTVKSVVTMATHRSIQVLSSLLKLIRSPVVDEMEVHGEISIVLDLFLLTEDLSIRVAAMDCLLEIAYSARKEVLDAMLEKGFVEKLVELQRLDGEGELSRELKDQESENGEKTKVMENPFEMCVARFAVMVEVGERLERSESREVKKEILKRVREASTSEAETATILAEVLWASSP